MKFILIIVYLIFTVSGLVLMKLGGNSGTFALKEGGTIAFSINWISLIGFICYLVSFLVFTKIIIMFELSYIMPICTGIVQIATLVASRLVFKEIISTQGIIGASLIIIGIILMNIPKISVNT